MTQPTKLFVRRNGNQLSFFFANGLPQVDREELIGLIEEHGGSCSIRPEDADYVISDDLRIDDPSLKGYIACYSSFITDCIRSGAILENIQEYVIVEIPDDDDEQHGDGSSQADIGEYADSLTLHQSEFSKPRQSSTNQSHGDIARNLPWSISRQQVRASGSGPARILRWQTIQHRQSQVLEEEDEQNQYRIGLAAKPALTSRIYNDAPKLTRKRSHVSDSEEEDTVRGQYRLQDRKASPSLSPPLSEPLPRTRIPSLTSKEQISSGSLPLLLSSPVRPPAKRRKLNDAENIQEIEVEFELERPQNDFYEDSGPIDEYGDESDYENEQFLQTKLPLFGEARYTLCDFERAELSWIGEQRTKTIRDQQLLYHTVDQLRHLYNVDPSVILGLLHRTSFRFDIVNSVLQEFMVEGAEFELNREIVGVFTIEDDEAIASNDPVAIARVQQRHGNALVAWRQRYWEIFRVLHQRERT
ncbi:hypothetical protein V1525DRAFT_165562 [Lipomyces kononenkoae]|uniref:Uncharacterized protein n=1 Tax=Lipomyces kononenkoae TaxID=34357 RepID=A0ACC3T0N7_LIPKO